MLDCETNVFPITNLAELTTDYRLWRVRGLQRGQREYYRNCQILKRKLSFQLRKPVTIVMRGDFPYLVAPADLEALPTAFALVRTAATFESCSDAIALDYTRRSEENDEICLRFLDFMLQSPLHSNPQLWQPRAGKPFFKKTPDDLIETAARYRGFAIRSVVTPGGGLGLCVDVCGKIVSRIPFPAHISRDEFPRLKDRYAIYHYGHQWYEVAVRSLDDRNVSEYLLERDGTWVSLLDYVITECEKPIPPELTQVPHDGSVLVYSNNQDEDRAAPASLCYPVIATDDEGPGQHQGTLLLPHVRQGMIHEFVRQYLDRLRFGTMAIRVSPNPVATQATAFSVPDLEFGHGKVLSVRGTPGALQTSLEELGERRRSLLMDDEAGFYSAGPLDRQYLVLPQSIADSIGTQFVQDLRKAVNELYPGGRGYDPILITYNDRVARTYTAQGHEFLKVAQAQFVKPGFAVVMIHHVSDRPRRGEDQLAAMVIRELRKYDIYAAVIHSAVPQECYELALQSGGAPFYRPSRDKHGKLTGYVRNVALNKVLLTNQRWPFVLATRLHADVTIGIDVKNHTAGLFVVGRNGGEIRTLIRTSRQSERLHDDQLSAYFVSVLREEAAARTELIKTVVVHRDGRIYQSELIGAHDAMDLLKQQGVINQQATLTILEIAKTSPSPLRLFSVSSRNGRPWIEYPQVGTMYLPNDRDGFVCTTGRAFRRPGTVPPLHVRHIEGPLPLRDCLEDVYYLSCLAWTRPEDCTRFPIDIKLNDRFLGEDATDYDADALEYAAALEEDEEPII